MITFLQDYLRINTVYPYPDYQGAVTLFRERALHDDFLVTEIQLPSGNSVLIITLQGSSPELPALVLNHHMDVVPANNTHEWTHPPFAGMVDQGRIYGRGAQDCKGLGVAQYAALQRLKHEGAQPVRTIHCILVPDEERGGFQGMKEFVDHPIFNTLNIGYVLDEGMPSGDDSVILIKTDERTPLQIGITARGIQGHASMLFHDNCVHTLVSFLQEMVTLHEDKKRSALDEPGKHISMQITSLITDNKALNVIPSYAHATIDIRVPSHLSFDDIFILLNELMKKYPQIGYEILATSKERLTPLSTDSYFYQELSKAISDCGFTPRPFSFEATTDARFYSNRGIPVIGLTPFTIAPNLHGTDEYIRIKDFEQARDSIYSFLKKFCVPNTILT